jgi:ubiquinone/menaquinone biosynthesis C-methylase UbiE
MRKGELLMPLHSWNDLVASQWNKNAAGWHANSEEMWEHGSRKTVLPLFSRHVQPEQGPVLDAGCAAGYASCKLAEKGYIVEGIDIAEEMIELARKRCAAAFPVRFQTGDVAQLPFPDNYFAGILAVNVVEFTEDPLAALREFHRVLQPEGVLLLGILGPTAGPRSYSYRRLYGEKTMQNTMMPWEAKQLAQENGFRFIEEEPVYREGVTPGTTDPLSPELRQALSFLTLFVLRKLYSSNG